VREVPCSDEKLVEAIDLANRDHGGTLKLAPHCVYELDFADKQSGTALPTIRQEIRIKGNDATIKRDSEDAFRLFRVADGGELTLKDLTLKDGNAAEFKYGSAPMTPPGSGSQVPGSGPQAEPSTPKPPEKEKKEGEADGGAILVERGGSAHLEQVKLTRNNAEGNGGAIANFGRVDLDDSKVEDNHAQKNGGGIFNVGVLKVKESRINNNTAGKNGGGIANGEGKEKEKGKDGKEYWVKGHDEAGTVEIIGRFEGKEVGKSEIENNRAGENGGGVFSSGGFVKIALSTIKNNTACKSGGGIYARNTDLVLDKVTVAKNHADRDGGGIVNTGGEKKKEEGPWSLPGKDKDKNKNENEQRATATIADSAILDNSAGRFGGGIFNGDTDVKLKEGFQEADKDGKDDNATLTVRDTEIKGNTALNGGGIFNNEGRVTLTKTRVVKNTATDSTKTHRVAGGVFNNEGVVRLDEKTVIADNDPTNCAGTVKDCFN
jgi:predicted outer membrane repeat protein